MDLGIAGMQALVCGASSGLGYACAEALALEGVSVVLAARDPARLGAAAAKINSSARMAPVTVSADVSTSRGRAAILAACPSPDILVTNAGGPAKKDFRDLSLGDWQESLDTNFIASLEMIRLTIDGMIAKGWGRIVNITSITARMPVEQMDRSTAARLALTGYTAGVARQVARQGVTINNLLPGTFATDRLKAIGSTGHALAANVPMRRAGDPSEFGATCAFLCGRQAGYITGQNILIDGGLTNMTI